MARPVAGIGVGIALREPLGRLIGFERFLEILRAAPAEQDDRDVEEEGDLEACSTNSVSATPAIAAGTILLPSATNNRIAAIVAQLVMTWLLAMRTALLLTRFTLWSTSCPGRSVAEMK